MGLSPHELPRMWLPAWGPQCHSLKREGQWGRLVAVCWGLEAFTRLRPPGSTHIPCCGHVRCAPCGNEPVDAACGTLVFQG